MHALNQNAAARQSRERGRNTREKVMLEARTDLEVDGTINGSNPITQSTLTSTVNPYCVFSRHRPNLTLPPAFRERGSHLALRDRAGETKDQRMAVRRRAGRAATRAELRVARVDLSCSLTPHRNENVSQLLVVAAAS